MYSDILYTHITYTYTFAFGYDWKEAFGGLDLVIDGWELCKHMCVCVCIGSNRISLHRTFKNMEKKIEWYEKPFGTLVIWKHKPAGSSSSRRRQSKIISDTYNNLYVYGTYIYNNNNKYRSKRHYYIGLQRKKTVVHTL